MSLMEPFIDGEAVRRVAEAFPSATEEQVRETVRLRMTTRFGYRRIGRRLNPPLKKDMVMRMCRMYEAISKPSEPPVEEDEDLRKLRARVAEKERLKRIREGRERLLRKDVLLSLENEGDDLVQRIVEDKAHPKLYQKFKSYCRHEGLSPKEALDELGVSAWHLLKGFDNWYDEKSGLDSLTEEVWFRIAWCFRSHQKESETEQK